MKEPLKITICKHCSEFTERSPSGAFWLHTNGKLRCTDGINRAEPSPEPDAAPASEAQAPAVCGALHTTTEGDVYACVRDSGHEDYHSSVRDSIRIATGGVFWWDRTSRTQAPAEPHMTNEMLEVIIDNMTNRYICSQGEARKMARELTALRKEEQRWKERRVHTQDWYARHYGELHKWARLILPEHFRSQFFNCIANGSFEHSGGTGFMLDSAQQQILHDQSNRAEDAEAELEALRASHKRLVEALSWALDLLDMYDKKLVEMGEPKEMVYAVVHLTGKTKARAALAEARKLEGK